MNSTVACNASRTMRLCALSLSFALAACGSGGGRSERSGAATGEDFALVLDATVNRVIVPTYADLHTKAQALHGCVGTLAAEPTEVRLADCRRAWVVARVPWEQSEGFLFGPVTDQGLDPAMDSWPVDHQQLDALLASSVELSAESITSNLGGGMKGFHTIEYLMWGMNHSRTAADLAAAPRDAEYLVALAEALSNDTQQLVEAWTGTDGEPGYGDRFAGAGTSKGLYSSQLDAVQELIGGMVAICDEVAFGKIADPSKERDPNLIESQFSYNSLFDFADNIRSIRNVYLASLDGTKGAISLSAVVTKYDSELDEQVVRQTDAATEAILAIGQGGITFRDAILDPQYDAVIEKAQDEIAALMDLLSGGVMPLFAR